MGSSLGEALLPYQALRHDCPLMVEHRDSGRTHEIQAQDPKRLMVSGQNSTGQVIEPRPAVLARSVPALCRHHRRSEPRRHCRRMGIAHQPASDAGGSGRSTWHHQIEEVRLIICGEAMGQYRLMDDACHHSNQNPSREHMICYRTWVRWSHLSAPPSAPWNPG